jgi:hypothetical protein
VPAIVNNYYGRWWWPEDEKPGANPVPGSPLPWTGDYLDGFHNKITMVAYANPDERLQNIAGIKPGDTTQCRRQLGRRLWPDPLQKRLRRGHLRVLAPLRRCHQARCEASSPAGRRRSNPENAVTIGAPTGASNAHTVDIGLPLILDGTSVNFNAANNQTLNLNVAISETGGSRNVTRGTGGGVINWNGANTFSGTLTLNGGGTNVFNSIADTGSSAIGIGSADIIWSEREPTREFGLMAQSRVQRRGTL